MYQNTPRRRLSQKEIKKSFFPPYFGESIDEIFYSNRAKESREKANRARANRAKLSQAYARIILRDVRNRINEPLKGESRPQLDRNYHFWMHEVDKYTINCNERNLFRLLGSDTELWLCIQDIPEHLFLLIYSFFRDLGKLDSMRCYDFAYLYLLYHLPENLLQALNYHKQPIYFPNDMIRLPCVCVTGELIKVMDKYTANQCNYDDDDDDDDDYNDDNYDDYLDDYDDCNGSDMDTAVSNEYENFKEYVEVTVETPKRSILTSIKGLINQISSVVANMTTLIYRSLK